MEILGSSASIDPRPINNDNSQGGNSQQNSFNQVTAHPITASIITETQIKIITKILPSLYKGPLEISAIDETGFISEFARRIQLQWEEAIKNYIEVIEAAEALDKIEQDRLRPQYQGTGAFSGLSIGTLFYKGLKGIAFTAKSSSLLGAALFLVPIAATVLGFKLGGDVVNTKHSHIKTVLQKLLNLEKDRVNGVIIDALEQKNILLMKHQGSFIAKDSSEKNNIITYDMRVYQQLEKIQKAFEIVREQLKESAIKINEEAL